MKIFAFAILAFALSACGGGNHSVPMNTANQSHMPDMANMITVTTELGVEVHVPPELLEAQGFSDAMKEIDGNLTAFRTWVDPNFPVPTFHFHGQHDEGNDDRRAEYVGNKIIVACYHEALPHLFCLSEAFGDMARTFYDLNARDPLTDWNYELKIRLAEAAARNASRTLYGLEAIVD